METPVPMAKTIPMATKPSPRESRKMANNGHQRAVPLVQNMPEAATTREFPGTVNMSSARLTPVKRIGTAGAFEDRPRPIRDISMTLP